MLPVLVEGRLQYRTWQTPDGTKRSAVDVVADNVQFLSRNGDPQAEDGASANKAPAENGAAVDGWGSAKKLQGEAESAPIKEENFDDIPF